MPCSAVGVSVDAPDGVAGVLLVDGVVLGSAAAGAACAGASVAAGGAVVGVSVGVVCATASAIALTIEAATAAETESFNALMLALLARAGVDLGAGPEDPVDED
jgi:hypothetical protein